MRSVFVNDRRQVRSGWKVLGFFLVLTLMGFVMAPFIRFWPRAWQGAFPSRWFEAAMCLFASWACLRLEGRPLSSLGLRLNRAFLRDLALGTLGGFGLMAVSAAGVLALGGFHWMRTPNVGPVDLLAGAWLFLAVACFEELLFRGYIFQRSTQGLGFFGAQVVFAFFFAFSHWGNPGMVGATKAWATLNIALAALLLGLCWRRTGSLALPIGVHLGWNWTQGNLFGFGVSGTSAKGWWTPVFQGRPAWLTGGAFGLEASAVCAAVCGLAILALWRWEGTAAGEGLS